MTVYGCMFGSMKELNLNFKVLKKPLILVKNRIDLHSLHLTIVNEK